MAVLHTLKKRTKTLNSNHDGSVGSRTFDRDVDGLVDGHLGLDENAAQVGALVRTLLHVGEPQGAVLKDHLTMIIGQLHAVL